MGLARVFLAIGIAVILAIFIGYGLYTIYQPPKYDYSQSENTCYKTYNCNKQIEDCYTSINHNYSSPEYAKCGEYRLTLDYKACNENYDKCNEEYTKQTPQYKYYRNSFFILIALGIISIIIGILLSGLEGIGSGVMGGGILIVIYSLIYTWQYWYHLNRYLRLIVIGIVLILLIALGYWKFEKKRTDSTVRAG